MMETEVSQLNNWSLLAKAGRGEHWSWFGFFEGLVSNRVHTFGVYLISLISMAPLATWANGSPFLTPMVP
jgi:hypothetical protein